mmetsp:Transcript_35554/g.65314  ORF Transcript_35554/g.65314 Transcript_35554/m.65314 type:complete len:222 (+) Transcript_35554:110-775(+)
MSVKVKLEGKECSKIKPHPSLLRLRAIPIQTLRRSSGNGGRLPPSREECFCGSGSKESTGFSAGLTAEARAHRATRRLRQRKSANGVGSLIRLVSRRPLRRPRKRGLVGNNTIMVATIVGSSEEFRSAQLSLLKRPIVRISPLMARRSLGAAMLRSAAQVDHSPSILKMELTQSNKEKCLQRALEWIWNKKSKNIFPSGKDLFYSSWVLQCTKFSLGCRWI